jgi:drug/metabolite transporter (DMT)-like permease
MRTLSRKFSVLANPQRANASPPLVILLLLVLMGLGWGLDYALLKIASEAQLPSLGVTTVLGIGGGFILICVSWARHCAIPISSQYLRYYAVCGIFSTAGPLFFQMLVARHIPVGVLAIVVTMTPVFTYVFSRLVNLERHSWRRMAGIGFGLAAALLLLAPKASLPNPEMRLWVGIGFIVPALYAFYHVFAASRRPDGLDSMQAAAGAFLAAGILVLPIALWQDDLAFLLTPWKQGHWAMMALLVIYSILGMMFFLMLKMVGPVLVSVTNFIGVIAGVGWGMLIFDERPTVWVLGSLGLLVLALTLTISFRQNQETVHDL